MRPARHILRTLTLSRRAVSSSVLLLLFPFPSRCHRPVQAGKPKVSERNHNSGCETAVPKHRATSGQRLGSAGDVSIHITPKHLTAWCGPGALVDHLVGPQKGLLKSNVITVCVPSNSQKNLPTRESRGPPGVANESRSGFICVPQNPAQNERA